MIFDEEGFRKLGITVDAHGKMPDVVIHFKKKDWLVLIEAVTSHGPIDPKRQAELKNLFAPYKDRLVFVTSFLTRKDLTSFLGRFLGRQRSGLRSRRITLFTLMVNDFLAHTNCLG